MTNVTSAAGGGAFRAVGESKPLTPASRLQVAGFILFGIVIGMIVAATFGLGGLQIDLGNIARAKVIYLSALGLTLLALVPLVRPIQLYHKVGRRERINRIRSFYSADVIAEYFKRFLSGHDGFADAVRNYEAAKISGRSVDNEADELRGKFSSFLEEMFGSEKIRNKLLFVAFIPGIVLYFAILGGINLAVAQGDFKASAHFLFGIHPSITSIAAIFGAYTWVATDIMARYQQNDFNVGDTYWYALRFIVAIPVGESLAVFAPLKVAEAGAIPTDSIAPVLAFVISMFSLSRIQQILGGFVNRAINLPSAAPEARDDIAIKLPGVDQGVADRLQAEGITTIAQIAAADPVRLSCRTNMPFQLVLELIDTAILWQMVGPTLDKFRHCGWTGASHVINFADAHAKDLDERIAQHLAEARRRAADPAVPDADKEKALDDLRKALKDDFAVVLQDAAYEKVAGHANVDPFALRLMVAELSANQYARFIRRMMQVGATSAAAPERTSGKAVIPA